MTWMTDKMDQTTLVRTGLCIAVHAVVTDVESYAARVQMDDPGRWYDTRPMLDPREHAPQAIDQAVQALHWGEAVGALVRHPVQRHCVAVVACP